jgi:hypothetical protein
MSQLEEQVIQLRKTIFQMLNYANMYVLVLDDKMEIKFANNSLAVDLGYNKYNDVVGKSWLDYIIDEEKKKIITIHTILSTGLDNWERYREFQNIIQPIQGKKIDVHWFNSHINTDLNWTFSFGIRKEPDTRVTMKSIRTYYKDIVDKDRTMINSMRDMLVFRNRIVDSNLNVENKNEASVPV